MKNWDFNISKIAAYNLLARQPIKKMGYSSILSIAWVLIFSSISAQVFSQALFTYGNSEVSKDEFIRAYNRNKAQIEDKDKSIETYLALYSKFKLKVKAAKDLSLDTLDQMKYDLMNFRKKLEEDYKADVKEALLKTNFKRNPAVTDQQLFRFADSVSMMMETRRYPIAKETMCYIAGKAIKTGEWLSYVKAYKLNSTAYREESNPELLDKFISTTVLAYYQQHLEELNPDFKYQLQEFKEGNLYIEVMGKNVWNKPAANPAALQEYYEHNKDHFLWNESADVILVNAKSYAYADYAAENIRNGVSWKKIAENSEGQIQADLSRYEIAQLPLPPGTILKEGDITGIVKNEADNGGSFVKVIKIYPPKMQRSFEEAKTMVINEYLQQLEENWVAELVKKYPVKLNNAVWQSLIK